MPVDRPLVVGHLGLPDLIDPTMLFGHDVHQAGPSPQIAGGVEAADEAERQADIDLEGVVPETISPDEKAVQAGPFHGGLVAVLPRSASFIPDCSICSSWRASTRPAGALDVYEPRTGVADAWLCGPSAIGPSPPMGLRPGAAG